uniref:Uncharacterized protein n=1 Tax=Arion vulgaris TaxID=1028688 RepID=A0A0B6Z5P0_9EUPU
MPMIYEQSWSKRLSVHRMNQKLLGVLKMLQHSGYKLYKYIWRQMIRYVEQQAGLKVNNEDWRPRLKIKY